MGSPSAFQGHSPLPGFVPSLLYKQKDTELLQKVTNYKKTHKTSLIMRCSGKSMGFGTTWIRVCPSLWVGDLEHIASPLSLRFLTCKRTIWGLPEIPYRWEQAPGLALEVGPTALTLDPIWWQIPCYPPTGHIQLAHQYSSWGLT